MNLVGEQHLDPRPCLGKDTNICVAEGCFGEACLILGRVPENLVPESMFAADLKIGDRISYDGSVREIETLDWDAALNAGEVVRMVIRFVPKPETPGDTEETRLVAHWMITRWVPDA